HRRDLDDVLPSCDQLFETMYSSGHGLPGRCSVDEWERHRFYGCDGGDQAKRPAKRDPQVLSRRFRRPDPGKNIFVANAQQEMHDRSTGFPQRRSPSAPEVLARRWLTRRLAAITLET